MDLEAQTDKIFQYLQSQPIHVAKANERPWGTYDIAISWDGNAFAVLPRSFGFGFEPMYALAYALTEHLDRGIFPPEFDSLFGNERLAEIKKLLEEDEIPDAEVVEITYPKLLTSGST